MPKPKHLTPTNSFSYLNLLWLSLVFGCLGAYIIIHSLAAPNPNLPGDLNGDNKVDSSDLTILLANYGTTYSGADINNNGTVDIGDYSTVLSHFGQTYTGGGGTVQVGSVEAENMTPSPSGNGAAYSDATLSGGQARSLWSNGSMSGSVTLSSPATSIQVLAAGETCSGHQGTLGVSVDGVSAGTVTVTSPSYTTYTFTTGASAGTHNVTITFSNDYNDSTCDVNLYVDVAKFFGSSSAPSVTLAASPTTVMTGQSSTLTWSSANVTSCTASGSWSGSKATSGTQSVSPTSTSTYTLTCTGSAGNANTSVTVTFSTTSSSYIKGYYDQGNIDANWNNYKQYGFNMVIADLNTTLLNSVKAAGGSAWFQPNPWGNCSYQYSASQALTWAQQAYATGAISAWYVADEPTTSGCSTAASQIAAWTATLHQNFPTVPTVIAAYDSSTLPTFKNSADMFALDVYPCQYGNGCNYSWITQLATAADQLGINYVGVPQAFGGDGHYDLPTASQLQQIIDTWRATKEVGYVIYAFSAEGEPTSSYLENHPELLSVIQAENSH